MKCCTFLTLASLLLLCGCESTGGQSGFGDFLKNAGSVLNSVVNELDAAAQGRQAGSRPAARTPGSGGGIAMAALAAADPGPRTIGASASISVDGKTGAVALREPAGDAPAAAGDADAGKAVAESSAAAGGGLDKSLFVGRNRLANAERHFAERLAGFPQNVMEAVLLANPDGSPAIEVDVDTGHVFANVGIRVVPERYAAFARSFRELLGAISAGQVEKTVAFKEEQYQKDSFLAEGVATSVRGGDGEKGPFPVVVATPADPLRLSWPVAVYTLDERMFDVLCKILEERFPKTGVVEVWLLDQDGEPVVGGKAQAARNGATDNENGGSLQCLPIALNDSYDKKAYFAPYAGVRSTGSGGQSGMKLPTSAMRTGRIDLGKASEEDLADVAAFEVRLEFR